MAAFALAVPAAAQSNTDAVLLSEAEIRRILADRVDIHRQSVGIVVGIIDPSGRRVVAYGRRARDDARPLDGDAVFELGSITKAFTSLLLTDAVARGEVALTDPIGKYLPSQVKTPERNGRAITLQDLALHMSGLPREPTNLQPKDPSNPFADYSVEQLYQFLSGYELSRDIGEKFEYSNVGAGLLGHLLALRAKTDYETLVRTRITEPLGMQFTAATMTPAMQALLAPGHNQAFAPVPNWDTRTLAGAGALRSNANDMLKFLAAAMGDTKTPLAAAFAAMTATRRPIGSPVAETGLGWGILKLHGTEINWSNGRTGGYRTWIGYEPRLKTGVVVLANADGATPPDDIGLHLLNPKFPLRDKFPPPPKIRTEILLAAAQFDRVAGRYQFTPEILLTIRRDQQRFFAQLTGQPPAEIFAESEKEFFYKAVDAQLSFEIDSQGKVAAVILHQGGRNQRAVRID